MVANDEKHQCLSERSLIFLLLHRSLFSFPMLLSTKEAYRNRRNIIQFNSVHSVSEQIIWKSVLMSRTNFPFDRFICVAVQPSFPLKQMPLKSVGLADFLPGNVSRIRIQELFATI